MEHNHQLINQIDSFYNAIKNPLKFPVKQLLNLSIINYLSSRFDMSPDDVSDKLGEHGHKIINVATNSLIENEMKSSIIEFLESNEYILDELISIITSKK